VFKTAEKALKSPGKTSHNWSPALTKAGALKRHWRTRLVHAQAGKPTTIPSITPNSVQISDDGTDDIDIHQQRYDSATRHYASVINRDIQLCEDHLHTLQIQISTNPTPEAREEGKSSYCSPTS
jgi:hypothetical protein